MSMEHILKITDASAASPYEFKMPLMRCCRLHSRYLREDGSTEEDGTSERKSLRSHFKNFPCIFS